MFVYFSLNSSKNFALNVTKNILFCDIFRKVGYRQINCIATFPVLQQKSLKPSQQSENPPPLEISVRSQNVSKAMKAYLENAQKQATFMKQEIAEYEIGRRHLANIMGVDADNFTQDDINKAIEYLLPSNLFIKTSRPFMKHPHNVFPKQKEAQFDVSGRPFHFLFYTGYPHFYHVLHEIVGKMQEINTFEDRMIKNGILEPGPESKLVLGGSDWLNINELGKVLLEEIKPQQYDEFLLAINRLASHPYAFQIKDFIFKFRKPFSVISTTVEIPPLLYDKNARPYSEAEGKRKTARSFVRVWGNGTGKISINGSDISYFLDLQDREQVLFPLQFTGLLNSVDVEATVRESGNSSQAGAVRYGLSLALRSFLTTDAVEKMRIAGLLTIDRRTRERKKPGQAGARRKFTWKKR